MVYNNSSFWRESKWRGVRPGRHICQRSTQVFEVLAHWAETSCGVDGDMLPLFESWCGNVVQSSKGCDAVGYWPLIANICQETFLIYQPYTTCVCWICNICRKVADVGRFAIIMNCCIDLEFQLHAYDTECVRTSTNSNAIYNSYLILGFCFRNMLPFTDHRISPLSMKFKLPRPLSFKNYGMAPMI